MSSGGVSVVAPPRIGSYTIKGTVGEGAFSVVKLAVNEELQQYFACKIVPKSRLSSHHLEQRFEVEIRINQQMFHPGIVRLVDILKDSLNYYIVMEFCPNGELFQYIVDHGRLKEEEARPKIRQVLETIDYVHRMGVTHRDLKPENILIDSFGQLKISDFGLSRFFDKSGLASTPCGSPCYASPECISGQPYDAVTTDVWSVGVILYAMVTGQLPWTKRNQAQLFEQIKRGEYTIPSFVSYHCSDFIRGLMTVDNRKRLTIEQALKHPFMMPTSQWEFQTAPQNTKLVSLKKVDEFFDADIDVMMRTNTPSVLRRTMTMWSVGFDQQLKALTGKAPIKVKRRIIRVKKSEAQGRKVASKQITEVPLIFKQDPSDPIRKHEMIDGSSKSLAHSTKKHKHTKASDGTIDLEPRPRTTVHKVLRPTAIRGLPQ